MGDSEETKRVLSKRFGDDKIGMTYSVGVDGGEEVLLGLAEEGATLDGEDDLGVEVLDGGKRELGDDGLVHERVPTLGDLVQGEVAGELDPAVDRLEFICLEK